MSSAPREVGRAHRYARERGVCVPLYVFARLLLTPILRAWFHARISGAEHIPKQGAAIVACNHKSSLDAFFIGIATRRYVRFMTKTELFFGPLGWLLLRLGAFPVRRGETDAEAIETARLILEQGGVLVMFPEGTRVEDRHALGSPHHGAGRVALETGAPLIPAAISGTHRLWIGPVPKPRRVQLTFLRAVDPGRLADHSDAVDELIDDELWPAIRQEYGRQLARSGLILAALATTGIGVRVLARRWEQAPPRLLGIVEPLKARRRKTMRRWVKRFVKRLP
ncbi:MAG: lysophospholipid acyltransferase family protein [Solirubrobacteraceae bacterium]